MHSIGTPVVPMRAASCQREILRALHKNGMLTESRYVVRTYRNPTVCQWSVHIASPGCVVGCLGVRERDGTYRLQPRQRLETVVRVALDAPPA